MLIILDFRIVFMMLKYLILDSKKSLSLGLTDGKGLLELGISLIG